MDGVEVEGWPDAHPLSFAYPEVENPCFKLLGHFLNVWSAWFKLTIIKSKLYFQRSKKLEEVEKELLETKAEENKESKQKNLTEVMKVVFTIYFRILKKAPSSKVLSAALEGLAK